MFDPHKPARTRDGRPAKFIRTDTTYEPRYPHVFELESHGSKEPTFKITVDQSGSFFGNLQQSKLDLENYTPEITPTSKISTFDPTRPVQRRDGAKARILCTDRRGEQPLECDYPIVALVEASNGVEVTTTYTATGGKWKCPPENYDGAYDLVNIPAEHTVWLAAARNSDGSITTWIYPDEATARSGTTPPWIACFPVTFKEGQGLTPPDPK